MYYCSIEPVVYTFSIKYVGILSNYRIYNACFIAFDKIE